jgi:purine-binding chemotaxis protein CheW
MAAQQLIVFSTGDKEYGIDISKISSIEDCSMTFYNIPGTPDYMEGIINLRGKIIPVMDINVNTYN